jgi:hypothetical protein
MPSLLDQFDLFLDVCNGFAEILNNVALVPGPPQIFHGIAPEIVEMLQNIPCLDTGDLGPVVLRLANYILDFR